MKITQTFYKNLNTRTQKAIGKAQPNTRVFIARTASKKISGVAFVWHDCSDGWLGYRQYHARFGVKTTKVAKKALITQIRADLAPLKRAIYFV